MSYCTVAEVASKLGFDASRFDDASKPTETQVEDIITRVTAEIDMMLESIGVTLPLTDTTVISVVEGKCMLGAAGLVGVTYFVGDNVEGSQPDYYYKIYQEWLKQILKNPSLIGVSTDADSLFVSNQVIDGTMKESEMNLIDHDFKY